jgi:hypothetical protein
MLRLCFFSVLLLAAGLGSAALAQTAPIANAGPDQTIDCAPPAGADVLLDGTGSSDPDDPAAVLTFTWTSPSLAVPATGATPTVLLPPGVHTITLVVNDGVDGDSLPDDVVITVNADVTPPDLVLASDSDELWPPNHKLHSYEAADLVDSVSDDCSNLTADDVVFGGATSDEADDHHGDGATNGDVQFGDACHRAFVRSERSGPGDGRVYELVLHVEDAAGNAADETFEVEVPHDRAHGATDSGDVADYPSDCGANGPDCAPVPDYAGCAVAAEGDFSLRSSKQGPKLKWRASGFAAGSVSESDAEVCTYANGQPAGGAFPDGVQVQGKKGKGQLSVNARGAGLASLPAAVASGQRLRLELHDGTDGCVAYEESAQ